MEWGRPHLGWVVEPIEWGEGLGKTLYVFLDVFRHEVSPHPLFSLPFSGLVFKRIFFHPVHLFS